MNESLKHFEEFYRAFPEISIKSVKNKDLAQSCTLSGALERKVFSKIAVGNTTKFPTCDGTLE